MNKKYNYILFDWDGTLAKTLDVWLNGEREMLVKYDINVPDNEIIKSFGDWEFAIKFGLDKDKNDQFIKELVTLVDKKLKSVELYTEAINTLHKIKKSGVKIGLVTTAKRKTIDEQNERFGIYKIFDTVIAGEDVTKHKPDPEVVYKAMESINATKQNTLIVGDNAKDIIAGKNAGIDTCLFYPEENEKFYKKNDLLKEKPNYNIQSLIEVLDFI